MYEYKMHDRVTIRSTDKDLYRRMGLIGKEGMVTRLSGSGYSLGVLIDGIRNEASEYGVFWFTANQLVQTNEITNTETRKEINMKNFNDVAYVEHTNSSKKYAFAIFDKELQLLKEYDTDLVIVNPINEGNKVIGRVSSIISLEEFLANPSNKNVKITAQVVGVVDDRAYRSRVAEEERLVEMAKKREEIRRKLDAEIERRKTLELYEKIAREYKDRGLMSMVDELKKLEKELENEHH